MLGVVVAGALAIFMALTSFKAVMYFREEKNSLHRALFLVGLLVPTVMVGVDWPGYLSFDDLYLLESLVKDQLSTWHSLSYSALLKGSMSLFQAPFYVFVFNFFLYVQLLMIFFRLTDWEFEKPYWLGVLFLLVWPPTGMLILFQNRDSTYSLLLLIYILSFIFDKYGASTKKKLSNFALLLLILLLSDMRQEGRLILLISPFLLYFYRGVTMKTAAKWAAALLLWFVSLVAVNNHLGGLHTIDYKGVALLSPATYILNKIGKENLTEQLRADIDAFVNINTIYENPDPYDVVVFHKGGLRAGRTEAMFERYQKAVVSLIVQHPLIYLESRWVIFVRMFNFDGQAFFFYDQLRNPQHPTNKLASTLNYTPKNPTMEEEAPKLVLSWQSLMWSLPWPFQFVVNSSLIPLLGLLFLLLYFKSPLQLWPFAGLLLGRGLIMSMLAPAAYFKYISSIWIGGWLLLLIFINFKSTAKMDLKKSN